MDKVRKSTPKKLAQVKAWREKNQEHFLNKLKEWREAHPDYFKEYHKKNRDKQNEYATKSYWKHHDKATARNRSRSQKIPRIGICSFCGSKENLEGHHLTYNEPYNIIVVCQKCHKQLHSSLGEKMKIENPCIIS